MGETEHNPLRLPSWSMARQMVDLIVATYQASGEERGRYHDRSFEAEDPFAIQALFLIETPVDDLAGIASWNGALPLERKSAFLRVIDESPLANSMSVQQRLRTEGAEQMALVIERADHLRLLLLQLLQNVSPAESQAERKAL